MYSKTFGNRATKLLGQQTAMMAPIAKRTRATGTVHVAPAEAPEVVAEMPSKNRGIQRKRDGRLVRRLTVYLPNNIAHELKILCAKKESDVSTFVSELVTKRLNSEKARG